MTVPSRECNLHGPDAVVTAFRADIDVTLVDENLRLTVEERFVRLMELQRFAEELRRAGRKASRR